MSRLSEKSNDPSETEEKMKEEDLDFFKTLLTNWMEELLLQAGQHPPGNERSERQPGGSL